MFCKGNDEDGEGCREDLQEMKTNDTGLVIKILSAAGRGRCIIISSFTGCELERAHIHESFHAA